MRNRYIVSSISLLIGVLIVVEALFGSIVAGVLQGWLGDQAWVISMPFFIISAFLIGYNLNTYLREHMQQENIERVDRNRQAMLRKVHTIWIEDLLKHSLYQETRIALSLHTRPNAVVRPLDVLVDLPNQADTPLPPDKRISQVFDEASGALLILGAPGAGKTILLLDLLRDLLDRAEHDPDHPIPVIFPLSSWAERRLPLVQWLVDELNKRYDVPRKLAQAWVATDTILPLLDGLDEVKADVRSACAEAINSYRGEHGLLSLVVSSRIADYDALKVKLRLYGAIVVQPLTREQVKDYLRHIGLPITPSSTSPLWELLDNPLMLHIAILTYAGQGGQHLPITGTPEEQRDYLFSVYVARMFERRPASQQFPQKQTLHWLTWLAWQMQQHNQAMFYLEHIQPDWLPLKQRRRVMFDVAFLCGVVGGLVLRPFHGIVIGAFSLSGLLGGLMCGYSQSITPVETLHWSWARVRAAATSILVTTFFCMVSGAMYAGMNVGITAAPIGGLFGGVLSMIGVGLLYGITGVEIKVKSVPNQGIHNSAKSAFIAALVFVILFGLSSIIVGTLGVGLARGLLGGLFTVLIGALFGGLIYGGRACLQHLALRGLLISNGRMPWAYVRFLDFAAQRILLRKVGGGYIFIHRLLLDYFAKQYTGPETTERYTTNEGT